MYRHDGHDNHWRSQDLSTGAGSKAKERNDGVGGGLWEGVGCPLHGREIFLKSCIKWHFLYIKCHFRDIGHG